MQRTEVIAHIKSFLQQSAPSSGLTVNEETSLLDGWFIDSLGIVQTVIFLEQTFGCDIRPADINASNFDTVATLAAYVMNQRGES
ncbi:MAG: acyl carrier protein [Planctomycetaceae bacterium]